VAVARALVLQPKILLLDEPLSNLDAKLRHQLRQQLKDLQSEFGITTVYVTHDQDEALAMSDRVAVFNKGVVEQVGTPQTIYDESATEFVCNFIGDSSALTGELVGALNQQSGTALDPQAKSYLRVEKATLATASGNGHGIVPDGAVALDGVVKSRTYHGLHSRYVVECHGSDLSILVREDGTAQPDTGAKASVHIQPQHVLQYDSETGARIANAALEISRP
jgi:iron(III) transport system ATP-binding protein